MFWDIRPKKRTVSRTSPQPLHPHTAGNFGKGHCCAGAKTCQCQLSCQQGEGVNIWGW
jgi:hypothetical protein